MFARVTRTALACFVFAAFATQSGAQTAPPDSAELARRLDELARRVDDLELGPVAGAPESRHGFGPAASKVYGVGRGISVGGYGEMLYENRAADTEAGVASNAQDQIDFVRQIVYVGYKFDDRLLFNSEIEFEHSSTEHHGSVSVEFAYMDAMLHQAFNARAGLLLVPMGFINELHEPPVFLGARRPETERRIIPTTWRAAGFGAFGEPRPGLSYRAYLIESLRAAADPGSGVEGFTAGGLRGGRQNGSEAVFADVAGVVRADYERNGFGVGGSAFYGNTGQNDLGGADAATTIWEAHAEVRRYGLRLRGLVAGAQVDDVAAINAQNGLTGDESVGSDLLGGYVEGGYELLSRLQPGSRFELVPYVRYETLDTQDAAPTVLSANRATDEQIVTAGAAFYPHPQVVVKGDYEVRSNKADTGVDQWNIALGYLF